MALNPPSNSDTQLPVLGYTQHSLVELAQLVGEYADNPPAPQYPVDQLTVICTIFRQYLSPMTLGHVKPDECTLCHRKLVFPVLTGDGKLYDRSCLAKALSCINESIVKLPDIDFRELIYAQLIQEYRENKSNSVEILDKKRRISLFEGKEFTEQRLAAAETAFPQLKGRFSKE